MRRLFLALVAVGGIFAACSAERIVYPVRDRLLLESLNGTWDFRFAGESDWRTCVVPGCWETQGLAWPSYSTGINAMTGLYHRVFAYNPEWKGRHVFLRFDGVMYGYEFSVNGQKAGEAVSAYNLHQFDITEFLRAGTNDLDVTVMTRVPHAGFDQCDDWSFGGITRDVDLFTVDDEYIADVAFRTTVDAQEDAEVEVAVKLESFRAFPEGGTVTVSLADACRRQLLGFSASAKAGETVFRGKLVKPALWTAETPNLHYLVVELADASGKRIQRSEEKVGVREVRVDGRRILVNNRPVTFRGVCLNEIDPIVGRAFGYVDFHRRLALMKRCHMNYIRTAHYPFAPAFYTLAAEMGFYLVDEVPYASGGRFELDRPEVIPFLRDRAERTVRRDKNCPAVVVWSIGNENPYPEETVGPMLDLVREMDPTRPRTLPHPREVTQGGNALTNFLQRVKGRIEVMSVHSRSPEAVAQLMQQVDMPILQTEYAHAMGNGFNAFEANQQQIWDNEQLVGGSIWDWNDQGVRIAQDEMRRYYANGRSWQARRGKAKPRFDAVPPEYQGVWVDDGHFIDTHGSDGTDGIVYANGYPKESWQLVRRLFSPVTVVTNEVGGVTVCNRHDFRSLHGWKLVWNGGEAWLSAPARASEQINAAPRPGDAFFTLRVEDPQGQAAYETAYRTATAAARPYEVAATPDLAEVLKGMYLKVGRKDGLCSLTRIGRLLQEVAKKGPKAKIGKPHRLAAWKPYLLKPVVESVRDLDEPTRATATLRWNKGDDPAAEEYFTAVINAKKNRDGRWKISYVLKAPRKTVAKFEEIGFAFTDAAATRVDWDGLGPWTASPGKSLHNQPGVWRLAKDDIAFDGNRGDVRWAIATDGIKGFAVEPADAGNVSFETREGQVFVSVNVHVVGYGTKFGDGQGLESTDGREWKGTFLYAPIRAQGLVPVVADRPFTRCYGW
ncbi:MAG: hypothetical protein MJ240_05525 [Kiritimatiellae bacterium]|nr:hypothetical protein [Kiritimatiellia bacterium]